MNKRPASAGSGLSRRDVLGVAAGGTAASFLARPALARRATGATLPVMVGSGNALAGMELHYTQLVDGGAPMDAVIDVVMVTEANPMDRSVGLGGVPNDKGIVALDGA
jgi:N4-(beta-N-acetylglucosaminyl)-L-asparaginase